jgi:hypothetical protein
MNFFIADVQEGLAATLATGTQTRQRRPYEKDGVGREPNWMLR